MDEIIVKIKMIHKDYPVELSKDDVFEYKRIIHLADIKRKRRL